MVESRHGVKGTIYDDVFFTEAVIARERIVRYKGPVKIEFSRQNSDLSEIKRALAAKAKAKGANVVMAFRYGQRKHNWWEILSWDSESWFGEGSMVRI